MKQSLLLSFAALIIILGGCCLPPFFTDCPDIIKSERRNLALSDSSNQQQESQPSPFIPDVYGGLTLSTLAGDKEPGTQNKWVTGPVVGLEWQLYQYQNFSFTPSIQYAQSGGKEVMEHHDPYYSYSYSTLTQFHSLDIQPYGSYAISDAFSIQGGPRFSYLLAAKRTHNSQGRTAGSITSKEGLKDIELGVGIGLTYRIPHSFLKVSANYNHGFTNRMDDPLYNTRKSSRSGQVTLVYDIGNGIANQKRNQR